MQVEERVGARYCQHTGGWARCIRYNNREDIDIKFEITNSVRKGVRWNAFVNGEVKDYFFLVSVERGI